MEFWPLCSQVAHEQRRNSRNFIARKFVPRIKDEKSSLKISRQDKNSFLQILSRFVENSPIFSTSSCRALIDIMAWTKE